MRGPEIVLRRKVKTQSYEALMAVGLPSQRSDILAVLTLVDEKSQVRPADINKELLDKPENAPEGKKILSNIESFGLVECQADSYRLTLAGKAAIESNKVMIPQRGYYRILTTDDPVINENLLNCVEVKTDANKEYAQLSIRNRWNGKAKPSLQAVVKPLSLEKYSNGYIAKLAALNNKDIQINEIDPKVVPTDSFEDVSVEIILRQDRLPVVSVVVGNSRSCVVQSDFNLQYEDVLKDMLGTGSIEAIQGSPVLKVSFSDTSIDEVRSMVRRILPRKIEFEGFGIFDFEPFNIDLIPRTFEDAVQWAKILFEDELKTYVDKARYRQILLGASKRFEPLFLSIDIIPKLPTYDDMLETARQRRAERPETYWYFLAPLDLCESNLS